MYKRSINLFSVALTVANLIRKLSLYIISWDLAQWFAPES